MKSFPLLHLYFLFFIYFSLFSEFSDLRKKWVNFPSSRHYQSLHQEHNQGKSSHCLLNQGKARFTFSVQKYFSWKKHLMRQWSCYSTLWIYGAGKCKVSSLCLNYILKVFIWLVRHYLLRMTVRMRNLHSSELAVWKQSISNGAF